MALAVGRSWQGIRPAREQKRPLKGPETYVKWPCGILVACRSVEACVEAMAEAVRSLLGCCEEWTRARRQRKAPVKAMQLMQECSETAAQSGRRASLGGEPLPGGSWPWKCWNEQLGKGFKSFVRVGTQTGGR